MLLTDQQRDGPWGAFFLGFRVFPFLKKIGRGEPDRVHFVFCFFLFFYHHFYFPAQLVGSFTLSDLLDKPWSQVSSLLPPGTCLQFLSHIGFSIPAVCRFSSNVPNSRYRTFRESIFYERESPYEYEGMCTR